MRHNDCKKKENELYDVTFPDLETVQNALPDGTQKLRTKLAHNQGPVYYKFFSNLDTKLKLHGHQTTQIWSFQG